MLKLPIHPAAKRLLVIRGFRSLGQGAMVVDLVLYLKDLHWSGAAIGGVTTAAGLVGAVLILLVGILSDKLGRKGFLLTYETLTIVAAALVSLTTHAVILVAAIVIAGFGRGQNGAAGPFAPAEQAWLAKYVTQSDRGRVFSYNSAIGFAGMAIGSILGGWPSVSGAATPLGAFRPVFLLVAGISVVCMFVIWGTEEEREQEKSVKTDTTRGSTTTAARPPSTTSLSQSVENRSTPADTATRTSPGNRDVNRDAKAEISDESAIRRQENLAMLKYASVNVINGLAVGLTGPMMVYWFSLRFGAHTGEIGLTLSAGFVVTALFALLNGRLAQRFGMVRTVTGMRLVGSSLMAVLPWLPNFASASVLYALRSGLNRGTIGNRTALSASLTRDKRRGLAVSLNALSMRLPSAIGPTISGYLFDLGWIDLPLYLTAALQIVNAGLYQWLFGHYDGASKGPRASSEAGSDPAEPRKS